MSTPGGERPMPVRLTRDERELVCAVEQADAGAVRRLAVILQQHQHSRRQAPRGRSPRKLFQRASSVDGGGAEQQGAAGSSAASSCGGGGSTRTRLAQVVRVGSTGDSLLACALKQLPQATPALQSASKASGAGESEASQARRAYLQRLQEQRQSDAIVPAAPGPRPVQTATATATAATHRFGG
eukprot:m.361728 g.361728  ORF g.361728 m.361728 type:complete len:184 (+) comp19959_c0_seq7:4753-5304(+)